MPVRGTKSYRHRSAPPTGYRTAPSSTWADPGPTSNTSRLLAIGPDGTLTNLSSTPVGAVPWTRAPIDGTLFADSPSGFFTSRDDGHTWQQSTIPEDLSQVEFDLIGTSGNRIYGVVDYGTADAGEATGSRS